MGEGEIGRERERGERKRGRVCEREGDLRERERQRERGERVKTRNEEVYTLLYIYIQKRAYRRIGMLCGVKFMRFPSKKYCAIFIYAIIP